MNIWHISGFVWLEGLEVKGSDRKVGKRLEKMQAKEFRLYSGNRDPLKTSVKD